MGLSKTKQARVRWLEKLGLVVEVDFTIDETDGIFIHGLEEIFPWQVLAKKPKRTEIEDFIVAFGIGQHDDEDQNGEQERHDAQVAQAKAALADLPTLADTLGKAAAEAADPVVDEVVEAAKESLAKSVVEMTAEPASEEPLFKVGFRANGKAWVWLSEPFRRSIAAETKELFDGIGGAADYVVGDIAGHIERKCLEKWGFKSRKRRAAAAAAGRYAKTVENNLAKGAKGVNLHWAAA